MASSQGALISLTFAVIISMPIQPPSDLPGRTKRGDTKAVSLDRKNNLLIDVSAAYTAARFVPQAAHLHNSHDGRRSEMRAEKDSTRASVLNCKTGAHKRGVQAEAIRALAAISLPSNMSEALNVIYSGSSCWALSKGKELRGIQDEYNGNGFVLQSKQMFLFFFFERQKKK